MKELFVIKIKGHKVRDRDKWEYFTNNTMFCSPDINDSLFYKGGFGAINAAQDIRKLKESYPDYDFKVVAVEQITVIREKP